MVQGLTVILVRFDSYSIADLGDGADGFLKTVEISSAGAITDTVVDTLEFDTVNGVAPDLIHVSGNIYAVAYQGDRDDGFLKPVRYHLPAPLRIQWSIPWNLILFKVRHQA